MAVKVVVVLAYLILAPFIGGLLDGLDRIISARMQRRKGPGILQPFYDLGKLFSKQLIAVNNVQLLLNLSYLVILMIAGAMLFSGADLLMVLFILSTADMFLIMAASSESELSGDSDDCGSHAFFGGRSSDGAFYSEYGGYVPYYGSFF